MEKRIPAGRETAVATASLRRPLINLGEFI
jgi:hypothetical protein